MKKTATKNQIPRPEYPRPQFARASWVNLNGMWDFEIDAGNSGQSRGLSAGKHFSKKIRVPFAPESKLSGIGTLDFMNAVWYAKTFTVSKGWLDKRTLLHFGAVDYDTTVWLNGKPVGFHRGGYSSFSFELTKYLQAGENTLVVHAVDDARNPTQPTGKQSMKYESWACLYRRTTGIWQTVWLEQVPQTYLHSVQYYPDIDNGRITMLVKIDGATAGGQLEVKVRLSGKIVGETIVLASGITAVTLELSEKKLWEPGAPHLYDVEFRYNCQGTTLDFVESYFGLRQVEIQGKKILINRKPVFQRLVLDQGFYPDGIYTAPTDKALKKDIELSQAMGFNGARLHQKVFEPRFLYWADKLGYLVWGEFPDWGVDYTHPQVLERYQLEWLEVIARDFNHPSIIGWCPFNETWYNQNKELLRNIYRLTKQLDLTRPVLDASGYFHVETDVYDCHDYEQDPVRFAAHYATFKKTGKEPLVNTPEHNAPYLDQPYMCSEYGGIWWNPGQKDKKSWGYGNRPKTLKEFIERYRGLTEALLFNPNMFGFCYTQLTDVELEVNGLYTFDRKPKLNPEIIRAINVQKAAIEKK